MCSISWIQIASPSDLVVMAPNDSGTAQLVDLPNSQPCDIEAALCDTRQARHALAMIVGIAESDL